MRTCYDRKDYEPSTGIITICNPEVLRTSFCSIRNGYEWVDMTGKATNQLSLLGTLCGAKQLKKNVNPNG